MLHAFGSLSIINKGVKRGRRKKKKTGSGALIDSIERAPFDNVPTIEPTGETSGVTTEPSSESRGNRESGRRQDEGSLEQSLSVLILEYIYLLTDEGNNDAAPAFRLVFVRGVACAT